jgi:hypothetical protein
MLYMEFFLFIQWTGFAVQDVGISACEVTAA